MIINIDFESEEAIYIQLRNQIIMGIATDRIHEGDSLPSVRQLAENIGINMHTVNKAYTVLKQEGYIKLDRRRGAVIALDIDKIRSIERLREELSVLLARSVCKNISREEVHDLVDEKALRAGLLQSAGDYGKPWFGQLMAGPQMLAYLIELNVWMERYGITL